MAPVYCNGCGARAYGYDNFCDHCGTRLRKRRILQVEVDCSPCLHHSDIARFRYDNNDRLVDTDRRLLQEALTLVTSENMWVWRNAKLTVYGVLVRAVFYSGDMTNKFVVQLNSEDRPTHVVEKRGWRLWFKDKFKTAWGWLKNVGRYSRLPMTVSWRSVQTSYKNDRQSRPTNEAGETLFRRQKKTNLLTQLQVALPAAVSTNGLFPPCWHSSSSTKTNCVRRTLRPTDVYCPSYIGHSDIADFLRINSDRLSEKNRQLLQEALTLVTNESNWVWKNAQLTVLGTHFTQQMRVVFYSGDKTNQYVVHLTSQDRPAYVVENRG
ncbi:hypothetical protein Bbelb_182630 [Branchiostoma belcheri]|nr:hypothetical protein Bbelb_182630 [Branchiostoma belcheri]